MSDSQQVDKMAKVRAAKKPPVYKNIHSDVKDLPDDHSLSVKNVKDWEKHNKDIVKDLKNKWRRTDKGKEKDTLQREYRQREDYINSIKVYLESSVWRDLFWGKDQENTVRYRCTTPAYDEEGLRKITPNTSYHTYTITD
jgi:hypothetical protein